MQFYFSKNRVAANPENHEQGITNKWKFRKNHVAMLFSESMHKNTKRGLWAPS
ncbi:hypothetical protein C943_03334 [Mariniradius saccharolyticus AK6]|uniref:Uncharacterized protein n=1 Tax=Mariniradius saccharolyticus AK6 TaxID=1239962 RepID=M7Y1N0_9BACT|nr:hypothetical protein C943_03334 [Mariniradius saccharolyticus AK6]